jgi:hypothetical protein
MAIGRPLLVRGSFVDHEGEGEVSRLSRGVVAALSRSSTSVVAERLGCGHGRRPIDVDDGDAVTVVRESGGDRPSEPLASSGYYRHAHTLFPFEPWCEPNWQRTAP